MDNVEVYVIEKFDKIKNCYVFWNVVSDNKKAKDCIYEYMMKFSFWCNGKITLSDGQVSEYDYFTAVCFFKDSSTITDKFRGHRVGIDSTNYCYYT